LIKSIYKEKNPILNNIILFVFLYFIGSHLRFKWMSSNVHFTIGLYGSLFISAYLRRKKKKRKRIQQSIDCQQQLFNILPFFYYYISNSNDVMADGRERMMADCRLGNSFFSCRTEEKKSREKRKK
jgi:hypothetical protein